MIRFVDYRKNKVKEEINRSTVLEGVNRYFDLLKLELVEKSQFPINLSEDYLGDASVILNDISQELTKSNKFILEHDIDVLKNVFNTYIFENAISPNLKQRLEKGPVSLTGDSAEQLKQKIKHAIKEFIDEVKKVVTTQLGQQNRAVGDAVQDTTPTPQTISTSSPSSPRIPHQPQNYQSDDDNEPAPTHGVSKPYHQSGYAPSRPFRSEPTTPTSSNSSYPGDWKFKKAGDGSVLSGLYNMGASATQWAANKLRRGWYGANLADSVRGEIVNLVESSIDDVLSGVLSSIDAFATDLTSHIDKSVTDYISAISGQQVTAPNSPVQTPTSPDVMTPRIPGSDMQRNIPEPISTDKKLPTKRPIDPQKEAEYDQIIKDGKKVLGVAFHNHLNNRLIDSGRLTPGMDSNQKWKEVRRLLLGSSTPDVEPQLQTKAIDPQVRTASVELLRNLIKDKPEAEALGSLYIAFAKSNSNDPTKPTKKTIKDAMRSLGISKEESKINDKTIKAAFPELIKLLKGETTTPPEQPPSAPTTPSGPVPPTKPISGPTPPSSSIPTSAVTPSSVPVPPTKPVSGPTPPTKPVSGPTPPTKPVSGPTPPTSGPTPPTKPVSGPTPPDQIVGRTPPGKDYAETVNPAYDDVLQSIKHIEHGGEVEGKSLAGLKGFAKYLPTKEELNKFADVIASNDYADGSYKKEKADEFKNDVWSAALQSMMKKWLKDNPQADAEDAHSQLELLAGQEGEPKKSNGTEVKPTVPAPTKPVDAPVPPSKPIAPTKPVDAPVPPSKPIAPTKPVDAPKSEDKTEDHKLADEALAQMSDEDKNNPNTKDQLVRLIKLARQVIPDFSKELVSNRTEVIKKLVKEPQLRKMVDGLPQHVKEMSNDWELRKHLYDIISANLDPEKGGKMNPLKRALLNKQTNTDPALQVESKVAKKKIDNIVASMPAAWSKYTAKFGGSTNAFNSLKSKFLNYLKKGLPLKEAEDAIRTEISQGFSRNTDDVDVKQYDDSEDVDVENPTSADLVSHDVDHVTDQLSNKQLEGGINYLDYLKNNIAGGDDAKAKEIITRAIADSKENTEKSIQSLSDMIVKHKASVDTENTRKSNINHNTDSSKVASAIDDEGGLEDDDEDEIPTETPEIEDQEELPEGKCPECDGTGILDNGEDCPKCGGTGEIRRDAADEDDEIEDYEDEDSDDENAARAAAYMRGNRGDF